MRRIDRAAKLIDLRAAAMPMASGPRAFWRRHSSSRTARSRRLARAGVDVVAKVRRIVPDRRANHGHGRTFPLTSPVSQGSYCHAKKLRGGCIVEEGLEWFGH